MILKQICFIKILSKKFHKFHINNELPFVENIENMNSLYTNLTNTLKTGFCRFSGTGWMVSVFFKPKIITWLRRSYNKNLSSIDSRNKGSDISYYSSGRMKFSRLTTSIMSSLGAFKTWFLKAVDLSWIHKSFVYANIYLSFYFEGSHSNIRYLLVALKKDGNNVHFFDVLPHCAPPFPFYKFHVLMS